MMKNKVIQMKKKQQKKYESYRNTLFDMNYEKTLKQVYKELNWEYKRVLREIEDELLKWESKRASGAMPNTFGYSEEQHLKESKKAIELLIQELAEKEYKILDKAMSDLYVQDLLDMNKLELEYLKYRDDLEIEYMADYMRRNPMIEKSFEQDILKASANIISSGSKVLADAVAVRTNSIMFVEQVLRQPIPTSKLNKSRWYRGLNGKGFGERIAIRATQLSKEINQAISSMYAQGKGYEYATKRIADRLDVSKSHAKTLVQTECRVAEVQANVRHYEQMGVQYFGRKTVNDKTVCPICKEHKNDVYTTQELKENAWIAILHPHDRCIIEPLSRNRGAERYANRSNK